MQGSQLKKTNSSNVSLKMSTNVMGSNGLPPSGSIQSFRDEKLETLRESLETLQEMVETLTTIADEGNVIQIIQRIRALLDGSGSYPWWVLRKYFAEVGGRGWRAVAKAIQDHSNSPAVQAQAIELLAVFMTIGYSENSKEAAFLVDASLAAMKNFPRDEAVHYHSLVVLQKSRHVLAKEDFAQVGGRGWRAVAKAMQHHSPAVQAQAIKLLTVIMTNEFNFTTREGLSRFDLVNSEEAAFLVNASLAALKNFPRDEAVLYHSLMALLKSRLFDKGLVTTDVSLDAIADSFKNFPERDDVVSIANKCLYAVSLETEDARAEKLMAEGFKLALKREVEECNMYYLYE